MLEIESPSSATEYITEIVTILNPDGDYYSYFIAHYDEFSSISRIDAVIYDAKGNEIKDVEDDIRDINASDGFTIYSDNRLKLYKPNIVDYPYTVYYKFKRKTTSMLSWRNWNPIRTSNVSVENDTYKITSPSELKYFVKEINIIEKPVITNNEGKTTRTYTLNNYKAYKSEGYGSKLSDFAPMVIISPDKFNYGGYDGSYNSWQSFGSFIYNINSNRDILSDELKIKIDALTADIKNEKNKAKAIYEFMQDNTRYVSIQYGIGGHQPMLALDVEQSGYGDCKALSNYTYAMLNYVGVEAKYSLIKAGVDGGEFEEDIAYSPFNHAILCLPNKGDTLWLECTSQKAPFGFLGDFTGNRKALIITEDGGKLASTTRYTETESTKTRTSIVDISKNGDAKVVLNQKNKGIFYNDLSFLDNNTFNDQKKYFYKEWPLENLKIEELNLSLNKEIYPLAELDITFKLSNYANISNNRIFIPLNMFYNGYRLKNNREKRKGKIRNKFAYIVRDSIVYNIPEGYEIESSPMPILLENEFGELRTTVEFDNNRVVYYREYYLKSGEFSAEKYKAFYKFKRKKLRADKSKIVLVKKA